MALVIQVVEILWTKATRGAPRANARVALPRALAIGNLSGDCRIEVIRMAEWNAFRSVRIAEREGGLPDVHEGCLLVRMASRDAVDIDFLGTPSSGQPKRCPIGNLMRIAGGGYGQIIVNARHTGYSGQFYSEQIFNIACGARIAPDRFLATTPDARRDLRADLF